jgi:hypothetical protein
MGNKRKKAKKPGSLVMFFNPRGKWKYNDRLLLADEVTYGGLNPYTRYIQEGIARTPKEMRTTSISNVHEYWTVVVPNPPIGFPIMIKNEDTD